MATDPTERARLLELLAEIDGMIDRIETQTKAAEVEHAALLAQARDLRAATQSALKAQLD